MKRRQGIPQRRERLVMVRLSDAELQRFQRQAGREPLATWARRILLDYCERREKREGK